MYRIIMPCPDDIEPADAIERFVGHASRAAAEHAPITGEAPLVSVKRDMYCCHADGTLATEIGDYGPFTGLVFDFPTADTADR